MVLMWYKVTGVGQIANIPSAYKQLCPNLQSLALILQADCLPSYSRSVPVFVQGIGFWIQKFVIESIYLNRRCGGGTPSKIYKITCLVSDFVIRAIACKYSLRSVVYSKSLFF